MDLEKIRDLFYARIKDCPRESRRRYCAFYGINFSSFVAQPFGAARDIAPENMVLIQFPDPNQRSAGVVGYRPNIHKYLVPEELCMKALVLGEFPPISEAL